MRFSIGSMFLGVTLAGAAFAMMRGGDPPLTFVGAAVGGLFGLGLSIWNNRSLFDPVVLVPSGTLLGAAAGAQLSAQVEWPALILAPAAVLIASWVFAENRRRRIDQRGLPPSTPRVSDSVETAPPRHL